MMLREGTSLEEFLQCLEEEDALTNRDVLVKSGQKVTLECVRERGGFAGWKLYYDGTQLPEPKTGKNGRSYQSFMKALEELDRKETLFETPDCAVLCYLSGDLKKDWEGNVVSRWVNINPWEPYRLEDGVPVFDTLELHVSEAEFRILTETGLALYCETTEVLYPVTEAAYPSMGRLLDCTMAFQQLDQHLLGTALLVAEKLTYRNQLDVICRKRTERVRPVVGIAGNRYRAIPQADFYKQCLQYLAPQLGIFHTCSWSVSDAQSDLVLCYPRPFADYDLTVRVQASDANRMPYILTVSAEFPSCSMPLLEQKANHADPQLEQRIHSLFEGAAEAMNRFEEAYAAMGQASVYFTAGMLDAVLRPFGARRRAGLEPIPEGWYEARDLFGTVLDTISGVRLPEKQEAQMKAALAELFYQVADEMVPEKQEAAGGQ